MMKLLIVDDELSICTSLSFALEDDFEVFIAHDEISAINIIKNNDIAIVLLDLKLGSSDGINVLKKIKFLKLDIVVIIMTAYGTIESSVQAIKSGAFYYITKPISTDELNLLLEKAKEYILLNSRIKYLSAQINNGVSKFGLVGSSKKIKDIFDLIAKVKDIDTNVLIIGESGTGKELAARAIHFEGKRKDKPFNVINCPAIPGNLLESELFGFRKGSFTGAVEDRKGIIELSNGGTLFLDEIGDIDFGLQAKLLRVIQDKTVCPIGSTEKIKVDVRFISATNKNLEEKVRVGTFREDLFYRLNVININMPPLRERAEDISKLTVQFIKKYNILLEKDIEGITAKALEALEKYEFKGNVRELENIIERAVALTDNAFIDIVDLPDKVLKIENTIKTREDAITVYVGEDLKSIEKRVIQATLEKFNNKKKTAQILGISERALRYKVKEYQENPAKFA